jgi:hypothetical protein
MTLNTHLSFLNLKIRKSLDLYFRPDSVSQDKAFRLPSGNDELSKLIRNNKLGENEYLAVLLALLPHVSPGFLTRILYDYLPNGGDFPEFGAVKGKNHRGLIPTGETYMFITGGGDPEKQQRLLRIFDRDHTFALKNILSLEPAGPGEPKMSGKLILDDEYVSLITAGKIGAPRFSMDFPAELITTELTEEDLVLPEITRRQVAELENWVNYQDKVLNKWDLHRWVKPGYRALFHGPSGTGKTLTAMIVGKKCGRDVFRIDLSMVISKYIGETEKNLSQLFDRAKNKDWILFFDEADALFGKRTNVRDAHDKYANQEVAYLLQKIENHNGLVILASNFKSNIDDAFVRRFQSIIYFPPPVPAERFSLWKKVLPLNSGMKIPADEDLMILSRKYEITGAGIVNVVHHSCLEAAASGRKSITLKDLQAAIEREYLKEGKVI